MIDILIVFILYLVSMIGVGFIFYKKNVNANSYFLGGRKLNPWVTAMSAQASDMSGWLLTGIPGLAYAGIVGAKEAVWTAIGLGIGTLLNWLLVAKRLRVYTEISGDALTIPAYLGNRFKEKRGVLNAIAALVLLVFFTVYTSSMFSAGAKLFSSIFGLEYNLALLIGAVVIVTYTFLGGFLAVSWTDLFQGILMFLALIIVPIFVLAKNTPEQSAEIGSVMGAVAKLFPTGDEFSFGALGIISALGWGLGYCGMPHILTRFMGCRDKKTIKTSTVIAMVWVTITMAAAILIGLFGRVWLGDVLADQETVFMKLVQNLFHPIVAGILLAAILAAVMSTADSQLLVASSAFANDIYKKVFKKDASDKTVLLVSRMTMVFISAIAFLLALDPNSSVFQIVSYAWAGLGASFGPVIFFSLYSKKLTAKGAFASILTGAATTIAFKYGLSQLGGVWTIYEIIPGFLLATAALFLVSHLDKKGVTEEMKSEFERMKREIKTKD